MSTKLRHSRWRYLNQNLGIGAMRLATFINASIIVAILAFLIDKALPALSWTFIFDAPRDMMTAGGIWPCLTGTFYLSIGATAIALPLGVGTAIYLTEYGGNGRFVSIIRLAVSNLSGVPSVIFGLFGLAFFVTVCGLKVSLISGILTLAVLALPIIINTTEAALNQVPQAWREASLALGANKKETIFKIILPAALPGILTGNILALSRVAGETAAIMYTAAVFYTPTMSHSILDPVMSLPYHIYVLATSSVDVDATRPLQYATAAVLVLMVLGLNAVALIIRQRAQRNLKTQ